MTRGTPLVTLTGVGIVVDDLATGKVGVGLEPTTQSVLHPAGLGVGELDQRVPLAFEHDGGLPVPGRAPLRHGRRDDDDLVLRPNHPVQGVTSIAGVAADG